MTESKKENQVEKKSLHQKITALFSDWLDGFTMHGFSNITAAENVLTKILFVIILLCMVSYCGYSK